MVEQFPKVLGKLICIHCCRLSNWAFLIQKEIAYVIKGKFVLEFFHCYRERGTGVVMDTDLPLKPV